MASQSFDQFIESISAMSVMELADLVKALEEKFGVSAAMPVAAAGATSEAATESKEEKSAFKVSLIEGGSEKLKAIKALRQVISTLGLAEAKKAIEDASKEAPFVIAESASKADAQKMKETLEAAGAKVQLS